MPTISPHYISTGYSVCTCSIYKQMHTREVVCLAACHRQIVPPPHQNASQPPKAVCVYLSSLVSPFDVDSARLEKGAEERWAMVFPHLHATRSYGVRKKNSFGGRQNSTFCTPRGVFFIYLGFHLSHAQTDLQLVFRRPSTVAGATVCLPLEMKTAETAAVGVGVCPR